MLLILYLKIFTETYLQKMSFVKVNKKFKLLRQKQSCIERKMNFLYYNCKSLKILTFQFSLCVHAVLLLFIILPQHPLPSNNHKKWWRALIVHICRESASKERERFSVIIIIFIKQRASEKRARMMTKDFLFFFLESVVSL